MSTITAVISVFNQAEYLQTAIDSAESYADEILICDDGSSDGSREIAKASGYLIASHAKASGNQVWGSNIGIEKASCEYITFLDSDNILLRRPVLVGVDYTFTTIVAVGPEGLTQLIETWHYETWPTHWDDALFRGAVRLRTPVPWGGYWRTEFLRENKLRWENWPSTKHAADTKTCIEWLKAKPTLAYYRLPCLAFRWHEGQETLKPLERQKFLQDYADIRDDIIRWLDEQKD